MTDELKQWAEDKAYDRAKSEIIGILQEIRQEIKAAAVKQFQIAMGVTDLNESYTHIQMENAYRHSLNIIDKYTAEVEPQESEEISREEIAALLARESKEMTREQACDILRNAAWLGTNEDRECIERAVELFCGEPCEDAVSRKDVRDMLFGKGLIWVMLCMRD